MSIEPIQPFCSNFREFHDRTKFILHIDHFVPRRPAIQVYNKLTQTLGRSLILGNTDHSRVCALQSRSWLPEVLFRNDVRSTSVTSATSACLPHSFIANALRRSSVRDWPRPYPGEISRYTAQDQRARGARSESGGLTCSRIVLEISAGTNITQRTWCFEYTGCRGFTDRRDSTDFRDSTGCREFTDCHDFGLAADFPLCSEMSFVGGVSRIDAAGIHGFS